MAKKNGETQMKSEETTAVAKMAPAGLPAEMLDQFEADAGQGVSTSADDTIIPILGVLQAQSPQVNKREPDYIEGAEAGDIFLPSLGVYWKGEVGLVFQPCHFDREWVRWRPRESGGGFVGRMRDLPPDARELHDPDRPGRQGYVMPDGTELVDTRYHFGMILNGDAAGPRPVSPILQALFSLSSTGHTFSRQWMTQIAALRLPSGKPAPSRARQYRLTTVQKSNAAGTWFGLRAEDAGWIQDPLVYKLGTEMFEAIQQGKLRAAEPEARQAGGGSGADDEVPF